MPHHQSSQQAPTRRSGLIMQGRRDYRSDLGTAIPHSQPAPPPPTPCQQQPSTWGVGVAGGSHRIMVMHGGPLGSMRSFSGEEHMRPTYVPFMAPSQSHDSACSLENAQVVATLPTSQATSYSPVTQSKLMPAIPTSSFESPRHIAACSVLLLGRDVNHHHPPKTNHTTETDRESPAERRIPLKKRKTLPCHVSPVSLQASPDTPVTASTTQPTSSSDEDEEVGNIHHKKIRQDTTYLTPKQDDGESSGGDNVSCFPSALHKLLSASDLDTVVEWLAHGKAWRIVRWDALRRTILPQLFPRDNNKSNGGSVDAFLKHLKDWGFEEITEGPDVGAYRHELFIRDKPELCFDMEWNPRLSPPSDPAISETKSHDDDGTDGKDEEHRNPSHSMLRLPSLVAGENTRTEEDGTILPRSHHNTPYHPSSSYSYVAPHSPPSLHNSAWAGHPREPIFLNYGPLPPAPPSTGVGTTLHHHLHHHPPQAPTQSAAHETTPRGLTLRSYHHGMPTYSPIRIQSTRGRTNGSFGVSNRGRRVAVSRRSISPTEPTNDLV